MKIEKIIFSFLSCIILNALISPAFSQIISVIQCGNSKPDSSYYDIVRINEGEYWVAGKHGVLKKINETGKVENIDYPNLGYHILKIAAFDSNNILLCGDKGIIYQYSKNSNSWTTKQIADYSNQCFYNMVTINDSTAFICGGNSKISRGEKSVPNGFILKTIDKGKTWNEVYKNISRMVWDLYFDKSDHKLYAIIYSPLGSNVVCSINEGLNWEKLSEHYSSLFHSFNKMKDLAKTNFYFAGGKNGNINNYGIIVNAATKEIQKFKNTGMIWDIASNEIYTLAAASKGYVLSKINTSTKWTLLKSQTDVNLYEVAFINSNSAYVIGSNKTILKIQFNTDYTRK